MRGILLLALGGALIWFGASLGSDGDTVRSPVHAGAGDLDGAPTGQMTLDDPVEVESESTDTGLGAPQQDIPGAELERTSDREPAQPTESGSERRSTDGAADLANPGTAANRTLTPRAMVAAPGVQTLARVLLESWLREDPTSLQALLNDEHQALPAEMHSLTIQFWETLVQAVQTPEYELPDGGAANARQVLLSSVPSVLAGGSVPVVQTARDPMARSMRMVLLLEAIGQSVEAGLPSLTAQNTSELMDLELEAPWQPHRSALLEWSKTLNTAQEQHRLSPDGVWSSLPYMVESGDNLVNIRKQFVAQYPSLLTCVGLLRWVNETGKYLHPGDTLRIPTDVPSAEVYLDARLLVYRHGAEIVRAWDVGIGKAGHETPLGDWLVGDKEYEPSWPGQGELLPFGHPDNPLGTRWLGWYRGGEKSSFGIHGTLEPQGVGQRVSQGCVRMRNADVEELYELLPRGSQVRVHP